MGWFISEELVPVEGIECRCPPKDGDAPHPHGDTVWLRAELPPDGALEAAAHLGGSDEDGISQGLGWVYAVFGVARWTFLDDKGKPVPCTRENIRRLKWEAVLPIAEKASELGYSETLLRPLVARVSKSSPNGRTGDSISPVKVSGKSRRKH